MSPDQASNKSWQGGRESHNTTPNLGLAPGSNCYWVGRGVPQLIPLAPPLSALTGSVDSSEDSNNNSSATGDNGNSSALHVCHPHPQLGYMPVYPASFYPVYQTPIVNYQFAPMLYPQVGPAGCSSCLSADWDSADCCCCKSSLVDTASQTDLSNAGLKERYEYVAPGNAELELLASTDRRAYHDIDVLSSSSSESILTTFVKMASDRVNAEL